jgi:type II secretory pathway pseudopilin PulG
MSSEESQQAGPDRPKEAAKKSEAEEAAKRALEAAKRGEQHRHFTSLAASLPVLSLDQEAPRRDVSVPKKISEPGGREKMSKAIWVALITAAASIVVAVVSGWFALRANNNQAELAKTANAAQSAANNANQQLNQVAASSAGTLERGQKLCRVIHGNTWRDGLIVPQNWTAALCSDYTKKTGGTGYQLGCIYTDGTNLAKPDGSFPSPNCGWN